MKNLNPITTVFNIIGIILSAIVVINDLDPIWICLLGAYKVVREIIPYTKRKKIEKEKEPD